MKFIAPLVCTILCLYIFHYAQSQILFSYGSSQVSRDEFLRAFLKNNNDKKGDEKACRDYLELYIRFKLKVKAAYDSKLDTLPGQKAELSDFRNQIADAFMTDQPVIQALVNEAFMRSLKDIHLAHIYIPFNSGEGNPTDTLKAWRLAMDAYEELQRGTEFGNMAAVYSGDSSVHFNKGDIGYITVFTLPYPLENLAYSTPPGKVSKPFRSRHGYHIFKNLGERNAAGTMKASQILFAFPPGADSLFKTNIHKTADSVYNALLKGASFAAMVKKYSRDNASYQNGGVMPEFGVGKFDPAFENAAFSLPANGAISKPFVTAHGYHIIQRIQQLPVNADSSNDIAMGVLKQQVLADSRMEVARVSMLQKIYKATGFKNAEVNEKKFWAYTDSALQEKKRSLKTGIADTTLLFSFDTKRFYVADWINYLQAVKGTTTLNNNGKSFPELLSQYKETVVREYYREHLENYSAEFAGQLKEFKDGNLLFEIMQRTVWEKAAADSVGLRHYFDSNKNKYWWQPGADAILFTCTDSIIAAEFKRTLQKNASQWKTYLLPLEGKVEADSGRFELAQLQVKQVNTLTPGMITNAIKNPESKTTSFAYIVKVYPQRAPRSFEESRGLVLNDYQTYIEEKWVQNLKNKYPVKINSTVLESLCK